MASAGSEPDSVVAANSAAIDPRLAFSTLGCPDWSWNEVLARGQEYGFQGVELRMLAGEVNLLKITEFQPGERSRRVRELESHGLSLCGLASSIRFHEREPELRDSQLETGKRYLELGADLGAGFLRVFGDLLPESGFERQSQLQWIGEGLDRLGGLSESYGIQILVETHGDFTASRSLAELMQHVHHPQVGVLWDTHHPWRFQEEDPGETWKQIGHWVRHTHWKDSLTQRDSSKASTVTEAELRAKALMSGHRTAHYCPFGDGEFPVAECFTALRSGGYCGWYCLEWEKAWHPEIAGPHEIFPHFASRFRTLWKSLREAN